MVDFPGVATFVDRWTDSLEGLMGRITHIDVFEHTQKLFFPGMVVWEKGFRAYKKRLSLNMATYTPSNTIWREITILIITIDFSGLIWHHS